MHPPDAAIRLLCLPLSGAASLPALPERPLPATPAVGALSSERVSVPAGSDPAGRIGWQFKRTRHKKAEAIQKRGKRFTKDLSLRAVLYLVLLTDNCQPIRPAGSDPAGTLTERLGLRLRLCLSACVARKAAPLHACRRAPHIRVRPGPLHGRCCSSTAIATSALLTHWQSLAGRLQASDPVQKCF